MPIDRGEPRRRPRRWTSRRGRSTDSAQAILPRAQLGRELLPEICRLEDGANLEDRLLARHRIGAAADPFEHPVHRRDLPEREPRDELLALCEAAVA